MEPEAPLHWDVLGRASLTPKAARRARRFPEVAPGSDRSMVVNRMVNLAAMFD